MELLIPNVEWINDYFLWIVNFAGVGVPLSSEEKNLPNHLWILIKLCGEWVRHKKRFFFVIFWYSIFGLILIRSSTRHQQSIRIDFFSSISILILISVLKCSACAIFLLILYTYIRSFTNWSNQFEILKCH